jgi:uncharacterized protein
MEKETLGPTELILRSYKTVCECSKDISPEWVGVGFPGHGLVGNIAAKHMIKELDLEWIGSIRSPLIPPVSVFIDGVLTYPYRIYGSQDLNLVILIGESPCPPQAYYFLAHAMLDWAIDIGTKQVICFDGFVGDSGTSEEVYLVAEPQVYENNEELMKHNFPKPHTGFISGLSGAIMNEALLTSIEGFSFLVPVTTQYPDPAGAAKLIEAVKKVKNLEIDTSQLLKDAERIQKSLMELAERNRLLSQGEGVGPSKGLYV